MSELSEVFSHPPLDEPVLVVALEGWLDAGAAASTAMGHLLETLDTVPVARFDVDRLLDHRARRPVMRIVEGVYAELRWPSIELSAATDADGNDLLLLHGAEPDHLWHEFAAEVGDLARGLGVRLVASLGAYPAPSPHTRPPRLAVTSPSEAIASRTTWIRGTLDVPAGIQPVLEIEVAAHGIEAIGVWAQVPHYVAAMAYPAAAVALLEGLADVASLELDLTALNDVAAAARQRLDELVANSEEHQQLVRQLEAYADAEQEAASGPLTGDLPSGDELAAEIQRFLRDK